MAIRLLFTFFLISVFSACFCQTAVVKGKIIDEAGKPVAQASVFLEEQKTGTFSDSLGYFTISVPAEKEITIIISYFGMHTQRLKLNLSPGQVYIADTKMIVEVKQFETIDIKIKNKQSPDQRKEVSSIKIDPKLPKYLPSAFSDFNKILATLPGVSSNSELTSQYNVRGGNFDENLVYVNDIEIYRPFLVRAGQQEGLSFINPDLVSDIEFSSGGWQPRFGDKLSSVLSVKYKTPHRFRASASLGLLGGRAHFENSTKNRRVSYVIGARQKSSQYLLNTLQTKGEYKPRFFDVQSYVTFDLTKRKDTNDFQKRTTLGVLASYSKNKYFIIPSTRETSFGTFDQVIKLTVAFEGQELLEYETYQTGIKFSHQFSDKVKPIS